MRLPERLPKLGLVYVQFIADVVEKRISAALLSALAVRPLLSPRDVDAAADLALVILRAGPRELVGPENVPGREPVDVHDEAGRFLRELLDAQDRDEMRVRVLRAVEAGAKHHTSWTATLARCVEAIRAARVVTVGAGGAGEMMASEESDRLLLDAYDQALARSTGQ